MKANKQNIWIACACAITMVVTSCKTVDIDKMKADVDAAMRSDSVITGLVPESYASLKDVGPSSRVIIVTSEAENSSALTTTEMKYYGYQPDRADSAERIIRARDLSTIRVPDTSLAMSREIYANEDSISTYSNKSISLSTQMGFKRIPAGQVEALFDVDKQSGYHSIDAGSTTLAVIGFVSLSAFFAGFMAPTVSETRSRSWSAPGWSDGGVATRTTERSLGAGYALTAAGIALVVSLITIAIVAATD